MKLGSKTMWLLLLPVTAIIAVLTFYGVGVARERRAVLDFCRVVTEAETQVLRGECPGLHSLAVSQFAFQQPLKPIDTPRPRTQCMRFGIAGTCFACAFAGKGRSQQVDVAEHLTRLERGLTRYQRAIEDGIARVSNAPVPPAMQEGKRQWLDAAKACVKAIDATRPAARELKKALDDAGNRQSLTRQQEARLRRNIVHLIEYEWALLDVHASRPAVASVIWKAATDTAPAGP